MNRDQASRRADVCARLATVALLLAGALLCWGYGSPSAWAQAADADPASDASKPYTSFYEKLNSDEPKTVVFRWRGAAEVEGRWQEITGEQVRIDTTGETYSVYYDSDGTLLEEFSARNQTRWPGPGSPPVDPDGKNPAAAPDLDELLAAAEAAPAALPPTGKLFKDDPYSSPDYITPPITDPAQRNPDKQHVMRSRRAETDPQELLEYSPASGRTLKIDLFEGVAVEAKFSRLKMHSSNSFVLGGAVVGEPASDVTMSVVGDSMMGRVRTQDGNFFRIGGNANVGSRIEQVDVTKFQSCGAEEGMHQDPAVASLRPAASSQNLQTSTASRHTGESTLGEGHILPGEYGGDLGIDTPPVGPGGVVMDVMVAVTDAAVAFTADFLASEGGEVDGFTDPLELGRALVHLEIFDANTAYMNSEIPHRLRLVHIQQTAYVESGSSITDLTALTDPEDGSMDELHLVRDLVGADFVHLITKPAVPDVCGIAWILQPPDEDFDAEFIDFITSFGLTVADCFGSYVVAHEIGHNQGCAHDRGNNPIGGGELGQEGTGLFDYSFGWVFKGTVLWQTIMGQSPAVFLAPHFSNPNVIFDGEPTGVPIGQPKESHNAQTIIQTAANKAAQRDTITPRQLANISTRGFTGPGLAETMIGGFIIQPNIANGPGVLQKVLIRGRGPSLSNFGLSGVLNDPTMTLVNTGVTTPTVVASNDDWKDTQNVEILGTGLEPTNTRESAILTHLAPGSYTVLLEDAAAAGPSKGPGQAVGGSGGLGIVEVFMLDDTAQSSKAFNISTRGKVDIGDDVMIGGFIIEGPEASNVVIRARGPSLGFISETDDLYTTNTLTDPALEIYSGSTLIAQNDDWVTGDQVAKLIEYGVQPTLAQESALALLLEPGPYTAIVRGVSPFLSGIAIVEVFDVNNAVPDISVTPTTVDCGDAAFPSGIATGSIFISNGGNLDLVIDSLSDQLSGSPFSTSFFGDIVVPGASTVEVPFFYEAQTVGESNSLNLTLTTNDPDTPTINIKLKGRTVLLL